MHGTGRRVARLAAAGAALALLGWQVHRRRAGGDLRGQVAIITGGSRGLGLLLAQEFAAQGCAVVICARDDQELERARAQLEARGAEVLAVTCDVTDRAQVERMVDRTLARFGRIDILVNNAGVIQVGPIESLAIADFEQAMAVNFWGGVHATLAVLPYMRARRRGRIVNITSIGGKVAIPHLLPYSASKFASVGFSEGLRAELARDGVRVVTVVPGLMRTGSAVHAYFAGDREKEFTWFSLGDALPLTSMSARRAARRIVRATRRGEAVVTLGWQAKLLGRMHDLFPGITIGLLGLVNRLLPAAGGAGHPPTRGMELAPRLAPSPLTVLSDRAARRYNQFGGRVQPSAEQTRRLGLERG